MIRHTRTTRLLCQLLFSSTVVIVNAMLLSSAGFAALNEPPQDAAATCVGEPDSRMADQSALPRPFEIAVPDAMLRDLQQRLENTRWPDQIAGTSWEYGTDSDYLRELTDYWLHDYDWRAQEARLNQFDHFKMQVFPAEIYLTPRAWAEAAYNIQHWTVMPRGGHFAALEQPELYLADVREFYRALR